MVKTSSILLSSWRLMTWTHLRFLLLVFIVLFTDPSWAGRHHRRKNKGHPLARDIRILNHSGSAIDIFWIDPTTNTIVESSTKGEGVIYGAETGISSYVGHKFEVQELRPCKGYLCRKAYFTVNQHEDQWIQIDKDFAVTMQDSHSRALAMAQNTTQRCAQFIPPDKITTTTTTAASAAVSSASSWEAYIQCLTQSIDTKLNETREEIQYQANVRLEIGDRLEAYACMDTTVVDIETSPSIRNTTYNSKRGGTSYDVQVLFETDHAGIRIVPEFVSESECVQAMESSFSNTSIPMSILGKVYEMVGTSSTTKNAVWKVRMDNADTCTSVNSTNSCDNNTPDATRNPRQTLSEEHISARVILFCTSPTDLLLVDSEKDASGGRTNGMLYFPKVGIRILPKHRQAVVIFYEDPHGRRDSELFVDRHLTCPVTHGTIAYMEYVVPTGS